MLPKKLILINRQCPGDILMLTAAVRDLHETFPDIEIGVHTRFPWLWENNPYIKPYLIGYNNPQNPEDNPERVDIGYKTPHQDPNIPEREHFIYAFHRSLERKFGFQITRGIPYPDIHLGENDTPLLKDVVLPILLVNAGSKSDFPIKQWPHNYFQEVVDALSDRYLVVQIGETQTGSHQPLKGVVDMLDKTPGRDIVRLMRQASAVITGVSFPMHLCAALNAADGLNRKCVVIAGRRENTYWEKYTNMHYLQGGCDKTLPELGCWNRWLPPVVNWKPEICTNAVRGEDGRYFAKCIYDIKSEDVIRCLR